MSTTTTTIAAPRELQVGRIGDTTRRPDGASAGPPDDR